VSDTLMERLLDGTAFLDDIEDWVDRWHDADTDQRIWDFLGLSQDEYALWVERPEALRFIVAARERHTPLVDLLASYEDRELVAARAEDAAAARAIESWLRRTGRLK
jgi:hypothetical protein